MEIKGEKNLAVDRHNVWRALNDPKVLQRCLPGCDTFEPEGDNKYRVAMQAAVGPVRARFTGKLQLQDIVAPESYALSFEGSGGVAGFGKGSARVSLEQTDDGTCLRYIAQAQVGGRLAQVGERLIDGVTKRLADDFFSRFVRELAPGKETVGPAPVSTHRAAPPMAAPPSTQRMPSATVVGSPQTASIAVISAAISTTAAAVAVLATVFIVYLMR